MAKTTGIKWTRSTFNPWIGCTEVSPGCDACYARELDARFRYGGAAHWGAGTPRYRTAASTWGYPVRWNRAAAHERETGKVLVQDKWTGRPGFWPVFPSLCDPFDNEVPEKWRIDFFRLIDATPNLTWLLLTKRVGNVARMLADIDAALSRDQEETHEASTQRGRGLPGSPVRGVGDRPARQDMARGEAERESLDRRGSSDAMSPRSGGNDQRNGVSASQDDGCGEAAPCSSTSAGLVSHPRPDTGRGDGKSQERDEVGKLAGQSGVGDLFGAEASRAGRSRGADEQTERRAESEVSDHGRDGSRNAPVASERNDGEGDRGAIRHEVQSGVRDLHRQDLGTHRVRPNVWIGASVVNQEEADRDIPKLLAVPAAKRFVSYEPALGPIQWRGEWLAPQFMDADGPKRCISQIIVGGESDQGKHKARPFDLDWARSTVRQCKAAGVAVFVKQLGSHPMSVPPPSPNGKYLPGERPGTKWKMLTRDRAGADPAEWPEDLRVQEFPA